MIILSTTHVLFQDHSRTIEHIMLYISSFINQLATQRITRVIGTFMITIYQNHLKHIFKFRNVFYTTRMTCNKCINHRRSLAAFLRHKIREYTLN
jgi:hypothetical protein